MPSGPTLSSAPQTAASGPKRFQAHAQQPSRTADWMDIQSQKAERKGTSAKGAMTIAYAGGLTKGIGAGRFGTNSRSRASWATSEYRWRQSPSSANDAPVYRLRKSVLRASGTSR